MGKLVLGNDAYQMAFGNATPIDWPPADAAQDSVTDSSGGTAASSVTAVSGSGDDASINNNFASVLELLNRLRLDQVNSGLINGSAS